MLMKLEGAMARGYRVTGDSSKYGDDRRPSQWKVAEDVANES